MQKKHIEFAQAKGAQGGFNLPFRVVKDALARCSGRVLKEN